MMWKFNQPCQDCSESVMNLPWDRAGSRPMPVLCRVLVLLVFLQAWRTVIAAPAGADPNASSAVMRPASAVVGVPHASSPETQAARREIVERALRYLATLPKDGMAGGEPRARTVTSLVVLAQLSSGALPSDPVRGPALQSAADWLAKNSAVSFFGGEEEPNTDHAMASLMVTELLGTLPSGDANRKLLEVARAALEQSLRLQDTGVSPEYSGGWRRTDKTRANDRILTAWYLLQLRSASLRGLKVPKAAIERAVEFISASQKLAEANKDEFGGFSMDAYGLPVRSSTAAGMTALILFNPDPRRVDAAHAWLDRHPPRWYGPQFFDFNFFAARALYRFRSADGGECYRRYLGRLVKLIKERQDPDGSVPFPPGHSGPTVAMGLGYSTAMAVLILNHDRGFLPLDVDESAGWP